MNKELMQALKYSDAEACKLEVTLRIFVGRLGQVSLASLSEIPGLDDRQGIYKCASQVLEYVTDEGETQ